MAEYSNRARALDAIRAAFDFAEKETAMPAYWLARSRVDDWSQYKKYTDLVPAIIAQFQGKVLARGGRYRIMEGPASFNRVVVIEFPTMDLAVACFESKAYQDAAGFRRAGGGVVENVIVESGEFTPT